MGIMKKPNLESNDILQLWQGSSLDLLKALHILTRDGKINQDSRRKLKQVYHLVQLIEPLIAKAFLKDEKPIIVDMGSGKSYLGFLLYDLLLREKEFGSILSIESRSELVAQSIALAKSAKFDRMEFLESTIDQYEWKNSSPPSLITALHACDTATDDAIFFGLKNKTQAFAIVPCCQAEVSRLLEKSDDSEISSLWNYPIHKREFGSHLTNVIRVLVLKSLGYSVTVTELVGWEHSMKNELILAHKTNNGNADARRQLDALLNKINIEPKLIKLTSELSFQK
jgi:hypothetical protein